MRRRTACIEFGRIPLPVAPNMWNAAEAMKESESGRSGTRSLPPPFKIQLPVYHSALKVASREDVNLANSVFTHLRQNAMVQPDHEAWKLYISAYCNAKDPSGPMKALEELVSESKQPTLALYHHLLSAFGKAGDVEGLQKALPNNIILDAEAVSGNVDGAMAILATMKKDAKRMPHVEPTLNTYNTLFNMYGVRWWTPGRLAPDVVFYHWLMDGYRKANDLVGVRSTYESYCTGGILPDDTAYGILISAFGFRSDLEAAQGYFEGMLGGGYLRIERYLDNS
ncbi:hypothetical protein BJ742DRAFT_767184 [Cladochytrium replicatum]|nr:hypothetical protein BJ742DRAFT_767184 [Cladochytrium replicatum]